MTTAADFTEKKQQAVTQPLNMFSTTYKAQVCPRSHRQGELIKRPEKLKIA